MTIGNPNPNSDTSPSDLRFSIIQEAWVAKNAKHLSIDKPELVLNLGHPRYSEREKASEKLRFMGLDAWRYLVWATYSQDAEISHRGYEIILMYFKCEVCHGTGNVIGDIFDGEDIEGIEVSYPCSSCNSKGYFYKIKKLTNGEKGWK